MARQPNILFLLSDQHRADAIGCAGNAGIQTPHLDALASRGVRFANAFCSGPLCMPSRASMLTGVYPHNHGILDNASGNVMPHLPTFTRALQQSGYHTAGVGKFHFFMHDSTPDVDSQHESALGLGFDELVEVEGKEISEVQRGPFTRYLAERGLETTHRDDYRSRRRDHPVWHSAPSPLGEEHHHDAFISRLAVDWLQDWSGDRPFFLQVGWVGPHVPWDAPGRYAAMYDPAGVAPPAQGPFDGHPDSVRAKVERFGLDRATPDELAAMIASYRGLISHIDAWIGRILDTLERRGLADNTVVVYGSDHGEQLGEHGLIQKSVFYEPSVRVPLIVADPRRGTRGDCRAPVEMLDLCSTFTDLAGAEPVRSAQGASLVPLLDAPDDVPTGWRDAVYSELRDEVMIRTSNYKYVLRPRDDRQELFDLERDPGELDNLSGDRRHGDIETALRDRLLGWLVSSAQPVRTRDLQPGILPDYRFGEGQPLRV